MTRQGKSDLQACLPATIHCDIIYLSGDASRMTRMADRRKWGMSDKLDRFTKRSRQALTLAQDEAQRLGHRYIGTEHLLLGLLREEQGVAAKVLTHMGVSLERVRQMVEETIGHEERPAIASLELLRVPSVCWNSLLMRPGDWATTTSGQSTCFSD